MGPDTGDGFMSSQKCERNHTLKNLKTIITQKLNYAKITFNKFYFNSNSKQEDCFFLTNIALDYCFWSFS